MPFAPDRRRTPWRLPSSTVLLSCRPQMARCTFGLPSDIGHRQGTSHRISPEGTEISLYYDEIAHVLFAMNLDITHPSGPTGPTTCASPRDGRSSLQCYLGRDV